MAAAPVEAIEQVRSTVIDLALRFGPKLLTAMIILIIGYLIGRQISRWLERALLHLEMEPPVRSLIIRIARVLISLLFVIMALQNLGVELLPLVAGLGVMGAGIALATQGLLSNLFAGLTIKPVPDKQIEFPADEPLRLDPPVTDPALTTASARQPLSSVTERTTNILDRDQPMRKSEAR